MIDDLNQTRIFFTLNGKFLGCVFNQVPIGMDCFPTGIKNKIKQNEIS
jgi:hypothetical protein